MIGVDGIVFVLGSVIIVGVNCMLCVGVFNVVVDVLFSLGNVLVCLFSVLGVVNVDVMVFGGVIVLGGLFLFGVFDLVDSFVVESMSGNFSVVKLLVMGVG